MGMLTTTVPYKLERAVRKAARDKGKTIEALMREFLEWGLEQVRWESIADALHARGQRIDSPKTEIGDLRLAKRRRVQPEPAVVRPQTKR